MRNPRSRCCEKMLNRFLAGHPAKGPQNFPMSDPIDVGDGGPARAAALSNTNSSTRRQTHRSLTRRRCHPHCYQLLLRQHLLGLQTALVPTAAICRSRTTSSSGRSSCGSSRHLLRHRHHSRPYRHRASGRPDGLTHQWCLVGALCRATMVLSPSVSAHGYLLPDERRPGTAMPLTCNAPTSPGTTTSDRGVQKPPKLVMSPTAATLRPYLHRSPTSLSRSPGTEQSSAAVEEGKRASVHNRLHELHAHKLAELELRRQESVNAVYLHSLPLRQRAEMDARPFGTSSHQSQQSPRSPPPPAQPHRGTSTMSVGGNRSPKSPPTSPRQLSRQMSLGTTQTSGGLFLSSARGGGLDGTPGPGAYPADNSSSFKPPSPSGGFNLSSGTGSSRTLNRSSSNGRIESRSPGTSAAFKSAVPRTALPAPRNGPGPAAYSPPRADSSAPLGECGAEARPLVSNQSMLH